MKGSISTGLAVACALMALVGEPGAGVVQAAHARPTPTRTATPTASPRPTSTSTATPSPSPSATNTGTASPTVSPTITPSPSPTPSPAPGYNGAQAAAYADQYWSSYNAAWPSFATSGGDCTNFVSQSLNAGGLAMRLSPPYSGTAAWYMTGSAPTWSYSTTWVNANDNTVFLGNGLQATKIGTYTGLGPGVTVPSGASQGDVISYDWNGDGIVDHQAIVATADGQEVDAHTNDRYHAYWTLAAYNAQWQTTDHHGLSHHAGDAVEDVMARRWPRGLVVGVSLLALTGAGARAQAAPSSETAAQAVMAQDLSVAVAPWIPCQHGQAAPLTPAQVRTQQRRVDALISRTYTATEPTHAAIGTRLKATIASYGSGGTATRAGDRLCDVGGGIDHVQVQASTRSGSRIRLTLEAREWNETRGRQHGTPFHTTLRAVIRQTDVLVLVRGQWRVSERGTPTFISGAP